MTLKAQDSTAPAAVETQSSSPKSPPGGGIWAVQLGSFASKVNADKLVHQMKAAGSPVYVVPSGSGASLRYRVRVGPLADRGSAEHAMQKLKASGHPATLVTPAS
jgi:DedD protein